jgi:hypothetical protein
MTGQQHAQHKMKTQYEKVSQWKMVTVIAVCLEIETGFPPASKNRSTGKSTTDPLTPKRGRYKFVYKWFGNKKD